MHKRKTPATVVVYSESLGHRDYLRSRLEENGFNPVCFENENSCIDNLRPVRPQIVIARTDCRKVGWRLVMALNLLKISNPLVFMSHRLSIDQYAVWPSGVPIYALSMENNGDRWIKTIDNILGQERSFRNMTSIPPFLGESDAIAAIRSMLPGIAASKDPILIVGEKGTGKELLSRNIAGTSKTDPLFVKIDCGALQADVALSQWLGEIIAQESNTLPIIILMSNLHQLSRHDQVDLLLFMDKVETWKLTPRQQQARNIRIIATSKVNIVTLVEQGAFRKDLYYRLNVIPISIPPLRARKRDISLLMDYFTIGASITHNKCVMIPSDKTRETMYMHDWPGNVKELKGYMERVVTTGDENCIMANGHLMAPQKDKRAYLSCVATLEALPNSFEIQHFLNAKRNLTLKAISKEFEMRTEIRFLQRALELTNWNRKKAAEMLNISYKTMLNKMKVYDII